MTFPMLLFGLGAFFLALSILGYIVECVGRQS